MPDPSDLNALYQEWLEIPADRLPPNHYALLGIPDFESDSEVIETAAKSRSAYLHQIAAGPQRKIVQDMLGKVAIARRTLMSDESRNQYEESLKSIVADDASQPDAPAATAAGSGAVSDPPSNESDADNQKQASAPPRKKSGDFKYHAISAGALLLIVGVIYWVNRNPGGRKAAQIQAASNEPASTQELPKQQPKTAAKGKSRKAPATASDNATSRRSPIAKKRETGSGLGMGLGNKFEGVLTDIATQSTETNDGAGRDKESAEFRPLGGLAIGSTNTKAKKNDLPADLTPVSQFPSEIPERYSSDQGFEWYTADDDKIVVSISKAKTPFSLSDQEFQVESGAAIQLTTSLSSKTRREARVGFVIDGMQIGLKPSRGAIEVFAKDRGDDATADLVSKIKSNANKCTLTIRRGEKNVDSIEWFVQSGAQIYSGVIGVTFGEEPIRAGIFATPPNQKSKQALWISNVMVRPAKQ